MNKISIIVFISVIVISINTMAQQNKNSIEINKKIEALLSKVGGKKVWEKAKGFNMLEIAHYSNLKRPLVREFWVDFEKPRIKMITKSVERKSTNVLNIDKGWTKNLEEVTVWDSKRVEEFNSFWPGIPTRIFHLIAKNDPALSYKIYEDRIDFFIKDKFVVWIATSKDGTPVAYGRNKNHSETHFLGEVMNYGNVNLWKEAFEPGGQWRVVMVDYILLNDMSKIEFEIN